MRVSWATTIVCRRMVALCEQSIHPHGEGTSKILRLLVEWWEIVSDRRPLTKPRWAHYIDRLAILAAHFQDWISLGKERQKEITKERKSRKKLNKTRGANGQDPYQLPDLPNNFTPMLLEDLARSCDLFSNPSSRLRGIIEEGLELPNSCIRIGCFTQDIVEHLFSLARNVAGSTRNLTIAFMKSFIKQTMEHDDLFFSEDTLRDDDSLIGSSPHGNSSYSSLTSLIRSSAEQSSSPSVPIARRTLTFQDIPKFVVESDETAILIFHDITQNKTWFTDHQLESCHHIVGAILSQTIDRQGIKRSSVVSPRVSVTPYSSSISLSDKGQILEQLRKELDLSAALSMDLVDHISPAELATVTISENDDAIEFLDDEEEQIDLHQDEVDSEDNFRNKESENQFSIVDDVPIAESCRRDADAVSGDQQLPLFDKSIWKKIERIPRSIKSAQRTLVLKELVKEPATSFAQFSETLAHTRSGAILINNQHFFRFFVPLFKSIYTTFSNGDKVPTDLKPTVQYFLQHPTLRKMFLDNLKNINVNLIYVSELYSRIVEASIRFIVRADLLPIFHQLLHEKKEPESENPEKTPQKRTRDSRVNLRTMLKVQRST